MLGANVSVKEPVGLLGGELEHTFRLAAEGNLDRSRHLLPEDRAALDFLANTFERQMRSRENTAGQPLAFTNQAEEQVLGLNRRATELRGFIAGEKKNAPRSFRISFKHPTFDRKTGVSWAFLKALYGMPSASPTP